MIQRQYLSMAEAAGRLNASENDMRIAIINRLLVPAMMFSEPLQPARMDAGSITAHGDPGSPSGLVFLRFPKQIAPFNCAFQLGSDSADGMDSAQWWQLPHAVTLDGAISEGVITCPQVDAMATKTRGLTARQEPSALKLILLMAMHAYSYDPRATKSPLPLELERLGERIGVRVGDDTIRTLLKRAAFDHLPGEAIPKLQSEVRLCGLPTCARVKSEPWPTTN